MKIEAREAMELGVWLDLCDMKGFSVWCVIEGQMDEDNEIPLSIDEAKKLGIVKK